VWKWVSRRTAAAYGRFGAVELLVDGGPMNAQLGTDLAQCPTWRTSWLRANVHRATVTSRSRIVSGLGQQSIVRQ
jgi:hypothetical protein